MLLFEIEKKYRKVASFKWNFVIIWGYIPKTKRFSGGYRIYFFDNIQVFKL